MTADCSTPIFSTPEQLARKPYGVTVDMWAYGCVLVCLFRDVQSPYETTRSAYTLPPDEPRDDLLMRVADGALRPVLDPKVGPADICAIVDGCCRYGNLSRMSAKAVLERLTRGNGAETP